MARIVWYALWMGWPILLGYVPLKAQPATALVPVWETLTPFSDSGAMAIRLQASDAYQAAQASISLTDTLRRPEELMACYAVLGFSAMQLGRFDSAMWYLEAGTRLAQRLNRTDALWILLIYQGLVQFRTGPALAAYEAIFKAQLLIDDSTQLYQRAKGTMYLGLALANLHQEKEALVHLENSLRLMERAGQPDDALQIRGNLAYFYIHAREFEKARDMLRVTNTEFRAQPSVSPLFVVSLGNEALVLIKLGLHEEALGILAEAQGHLDQGLEYPLGSLYIHNLQALAYQGLGQWDRSRPILDSTRSLATRLRAPPQVSQWHYILGQQLVHERRLEEAVAAYLGAIPGAEPGRELASLENTYAALHGLYLQMGRLDEARACFNTLIGIKDSLQQAWRSSHLALVESRGMLATRDHELAILAKQQEIDRLYRSLFGGLALVMVFLAIAGISFQRYRYQRRREQAAQAQAQRLAAYNHELESLAFAISHTLKEPARTLGSFASLIERKFQPILPAEGQEYLTYLQHGAHRIQILLSDLLHYVELMQNQGPLQPVDLNQVLAAVQQEMGTALAQASLQADSLPVVQAHPRPWHTLFYQLLDNAVKYRGPEPLRIQIRYQLEGSRHHLAFSDNGIGISAGHHHHLFKVFYRAPVPGVPDGTGIGLAMVHKVMRRYGGEVTVTSSLGEGATFHLYFPAQPPA